MLGNMRLWIVGVLACLVCAPSARAQNLSGADRTFLRLSTQTYQQRWREEGHDPAEITAILATAGRDEVSNYRAYIKALTIMSGTTWSPDAELYNSVDFRINVKIVGPNDPITAHAGFVFDPPAATNGPYTLTMELLKTDETKEADLKETIPLGDITKHKAKETIPVTFVPGKQVGPGIHLVKATLKDGKGNPHGVYYRSFFVINDFASRLAALESACAGLDENEPGTQSARYVLEAATTASKSYLPGAYQDLVGCLHTVYRNRNYGRNEVMNFDVELGRATQIAGETKAGKFTLAGLKGDQKLAYRSTGDKKLVPYRIYIPTTYDKNKQYPLAVFLHGAGGDENSFFEGYEKKWPKLAEERGYIIIGVSGRGPLGGYGVGSPAERDMLDLFELGQKHFNIDPARVYLGGHSMGGQGTWTQGFAHRDMFAAIAPMAGTSAAPRAETLNGGYKVPLIIISGAKDALMPVANARRAHETIKAAGYDVKYVEFAEGDHTSAVTMGVKDVFDFFDAHRKPKG